MNHASEYHSNDSHEEQVSADIDQLIERISPLLGVWKGKGQGTFPTPTVDDFYYCEETSISRHADVPYFQFAQTTWKTDEAGTVIAPSHHESGVLKPNEDGIIVLSTAHDSARTEILHGIIDEELSDSKSLVIKFKSVSLAGDERMVASERIFTLKNNELSYTMGMATTMVSEITHHLGATLFREEF